MIRTICVHSFRAGTGKTHIIANIAVQMAQRGLRVGIIDADLLAPGMHHLFGLNRDDFVHCLNEFLRGECKLADVVYRLDLGLESGIYLVPACNRLTSINLIWQQGYDLDLLHQAMQQLVVEQNLDYLLIDTHPGANEQYDILTAVSADLLLLTLCEDAQHYEGIDLLLEAIRKIDDSTTYLVINKALHQTDLEDMQRQAKDRFGLTLLAWLPMSMGILNLGSSGIYSSVVNDEPWVEGISRLVDFIASISV